MWIEFKINDFICLKLEGGKTNIYINEGLFMQCKYLLLNMPISEIKNNIEELTLIDDIAEKLDKSIEFKNKNLYDINLKI